jgi:hypothetical protein
MPRTNGFYWVKIHSNGSWEVARYVDRNWYFTGTNWDNEPAVIGPKIEEPSNA